MARRKSGPESEMPAEQTLAPPAPATATSHSEAGLAGNGEAGQDLSASPTQGAQPAADQPRRPAFRVGPILTDRNSAVECAVWESQAQPGEGRAFTVHFVTVQASFRDGEGNWKLSKSF